MKSFKEYRIQFIKEDADNQADILNSLVQSIISSGDSTAIDQAIQSLKGLVQSDNDTPPMPPPPQSDIEQPLDVEF